MEESRIEKIFTAENAQISKEIQGYLTAIPEKYLDFVGAFVNEVKEKEGMKLNDSIYFSLSDHIMGAISRLETGSAFRICCFWISSSFIIRNMRSAWNY